MRPWTAVSFKRYKNPTFGWSMASSSINSYSLLLWRLLQRFTLAAELTNRPQFSMVYTLIDHRNEVIKCSRLKWNHEPKPSGFTAKFWTIYGIIFMVYKSVDHGKLWSICFTKNIYFFTKNQKQNKRHCMTCYVISMVYTLIDHSSRPISTQGFVQLL